MRNRLKKISFFELGQVSFYAFFAFLPFQIDALVVSAQVYFSGFFSPYLSHFVYLSDVFLVLGLLFFGISHFLNSERKLWKSVSFKFDLATKVVLLFVLMSLFSLLFSVDILNSVLYFVRVFEFFVLFVIISSGLLNIKKFVFVFLSVISLVSLIGVFQYLAQESLGLRFFGEPVLNSRVLGVARVDVFEDKVLRIYGTFPHPNIFAAYLVFSIFLCAEFVKSKVFKFLLFFIFGIALILTFSRAAIFAFLLALSLYFYLGRIRISLKYLLCVCVALLFFGILMGFFPVLIERLAVNDFHTFADRELYLEISRRMFGDNIMGVGIGNFTNIMQNFTTAKLAPWLFQPVHNVFFLAFNELGVFGGASFMFAFLFFLFSFMKKALVVVQKHRGFIFFLSSFLIFIIATGFFDHYYLSLYQGQALLWTYFGLGAYSLRL